MPQHQTFGDRDRTFDDDDDDDDECNTGFLSEIGTKLRDWAVGQAGGSCYSRAALLSHDSKTLCAWVLHSPSSLSLFMELI